MDIIANEFYFIVAVNVTLEVLGCLVFLTIIASICINKDTKTKNGKVFFWLIVVHFVALFSDLILWLLGNSPGVARHHILQICSFLTFASSGVISFLYILYIFAFISRKQKIKKTLLYISLAISSIIVIAVFVSLFNGMFFYTDSDNYFMVGRFIKICYVLVIMVDSISIIILVKYREILHNKEFFMFLSFALIRIAIYIIQPHIMDISLIYAVSIFPILIIYVNIQSQKNKQLKIEMMQDRYDIAMSQIQPHFLFNALVAIDRLCVTDPKEASKAINEFALYLRGNLDSISSRESVPFSKELVHVKNYLSLEQRRFGSRLNVEYNLNVTDFKLPPLTLQPIVENAVTHGVSQKVEGGTIVISSDETEASWCITVNDNGAGFDMDSVQNDSVNKKHIGIKNARDRLFVLCGGELFVESVKDEGTTARIVIPKGE